MISITRMGGHLVTFILIKIIPSRLHCSSMLYDKLTRMGAHCVILRQALGVLSEYLQSLPIIEKLVRINHPKGVI